MLMTKRPRKKKAKPDRIILNGFVYHTSVVRHNPPVRYLVCSKYLSAGCRGRAILPVNSDHSKLRITQTHNHPPDNTVEDKYAFLNRLKLAVQHVKNASLRIIFDEVTALYPKVAGEFTYESLRSSLRRWKIEAENNTNLNSHSRRNDVPRYVVDGFVFHVNITKGKPPMRYLRCSEYSRLGCHARAVIPLNGTAKDIVTTSSHNHSPDYSAAEKILFLRELKDFLQAHQDCSSKEAYDMLSSLYPNVCREMPFETVRNKLNRWRRMFNSQEDIVLYDVSEKQHKYR